MFAWDDYLMVGGIPEFADCKHPEQNSPLCGTYNTPTCQGVGESLGNVQMSMQFFGTSDAGSFTRTFQKWNQGILCTGAPEVEYIINGTYAVHDVSDCGGACVFGTVFKVELTIASVTITANTGSAVQNLQVIMLLALFFSHSAP